MPFAEEGQGTVGDQVGVGETAAAAAGGLSDLDGLVGEGFVFFAGAGEEEAVGDLGGAGGLVAVDGGDDVGAAEPVGFGEVGGGPLGGVVGVGVVEADDVEAGFAGLRAGR